MLRLQFSRGTSSIKRIFINIIFLIHQNSFQSSIYKPQSAEPSHINQEITYSHALQCCGSLFPSDHLSKHQTQLTNPWSALILDRLHTLKWKQFILPHHVCLQHYDTMMPLDLGLMLIEKMREFKMDTQAHPFLLQYGVRFGALSWAIDWSGRVAFKQQLVTGYCWLPVLRDGTLQLHHPIFR